jgi:hypothetical protein
MLDHSLVYMHNIFRNAQNPGEKHRPVASDGQTASHNVVSSTPHHKRDSNSQL